MISALLPRRPGRSGLVIILPRPWARSYQAHYFGMVLCTLHHLKPYSAHALKMAKRCLLHVPAPSDGRAAQSVWLECTGMF
jgi:hypothetical protein